MMLTLLVASACFFSSSLWSQTEALWLRYPAISPDGKLAVLAGKNQKYSRGHLLLRELAPGEDQPLMFPTPEVRRSKFSPEVTLLATGRVYSPRLSLMAQHAKHPNPTRLVG